MNLTIDIGNTNVMICLFNKNKIIKATKVNVLNLRRDKNPSLFKNLSLREKEVNVIISSVVPDITKLYTDIFNKLQINYFQARNLLKLFKLKTNLQNQKTIGDDRLINIMYAKYLYKKSKMIIDFGTATTIDILDKNGVYDGGVITPGIDLSLKSLQKGTAKLPLVSFKESKRIIGRNTKEAIQSGFFWGYISMIEGLVKRIEIEKKSKFEIILTGGNALYFKSFFQNVIRLDEFFISRGLNYLIDNYLQKIS
mgnify:CR=1 FL=1